LNFADRSHQVSSFQVPSIIGYTAVGLGNFDSDVKLDLFAVPYADSSTASAPGYVFSGNGDGTFGNSKTVGLFNDTFDLLVDDVDGDGNPDVLAAGLQSGLGVYLNNGRGGFQTPSVYGANANAVATGNFNGDNHKDLVYFTAESSAVLLEGDGAGLFTQKSSYDTGILAYGVAVADFNNDNYLDLTAPSWSNPQELFLFGGSATFTHSLPTTVQVSSEEINGSVEVNTTVTFTATLTAPAFDNLNQLSGSAGGYFVFFDEDGAVLCGQVPIDQATVSAVCVTLLDTIGYRTVTVVYTETESESPFRDASGFKNQAVIGTDTTKTSTTTSVGTTTATPTGGQSLKLVATISGSPYEVFGIAEFVADDSKLLCTAAVERGEAECVTAALGAGSHTIKVTFSGSPFYNPSTGSVTLSLADTIAPTDDPKGGIKSSATTVSSLFVIVLVCVMMVVM